MFKQAHGCFHGLLIGLLELQQGVVLCGIVKRSLQALVRNHLAQGKFGEKLEGTEFDAALESGEHRHDRGHIGHTQHHHREIFRRTGQGHGRLDHDPQGALGANHQMAQVVTCIVLDQAPVQVEQFAGAGYQLQAGDPVPGHTVADNLDTAGVG